MIKKLDWSSGNVMAYEASGMVTKEEHCQIFAELSDVIANHGKVRIFLFLPKMAWPDITALGERFSFARKHLKDIEKYAVVSDLMFWPWVIELAGFVLGLFLQIRFRHYSISDELLAKTWIKAKHV